MKQKIAFKYLNSIVVNANEDSAPSGVAMSLVANMMAVGFMPTENLVSAIEKCSLSELSALHTEIIPLLKEAVGANVVHKPFYPNFPDQVMEAEDSELYLNALAHYWSQGHWQPNFTVNARPAGFEAIKFRQLDLATEDDVNDVFRQILSSADSIDEFSKSAVAWFIESGRDYKLPDRIPFKENICIVAGLYLDRNKWNDRLVKDTTDILRIAAYINGGDVSLSTPTKFKSLPRRQRRVLVKSLERVAREEDFLRHKEQWIKLLHNLHVGEYSSKLFAMAKKLREHDKITTFNGRVEAAIESGKWNDTIDLLSQRPGVYARMLGRLLTSAKAGSRKKIVSGFMRVVDDVPTRNLLQLWGSMKTRVDAVDKRVIFPKGSVAKAYVLRNSLAKLPKSTIDAVIEGITDSLNARFAKLDDLGKVWIDPALYDCPLPTGMRSASEGLRQCARGTRMPIGEKDTLRFFIYWKGIDIDLSATFHDENFKMIDRVAYYNLRNSQLKAAHSGDITRAPNGASEFIDVSISSALAHNSNIRYIAMNVNVFSGPTFAEHEECFAGWMTRDKVSSNEIYDPRTVEQKIDLRSNTKACIPVMFDLVERKAVWMDVNSSSQNWDTSAWGRSGNNVDNNKATIQDMIEAFASLDNKITLGELFYRHGLTRGTFVENREDADFVFGFDDKADVTPFDVAAINSEYVV
jgi:hypothetical protein